MRLVAAIARGTGSGIWNQDASTSENLSVAGNRLFLAAADGKVLAFDATSGEPLWQNEQLLRRQLNATQAFADYVVVSDFKGFVHFMDQDTGEFVARRRMDRKGVRAQMQTDGEILYVLGNRGKLRAYSVTPK